MKYEITDVHKFVEGSRALIYKNFGEKLSSVEKYTDISLLSKAERKEIDQCLSQEESHNILFDIIKYDKNDILKISEKQYLKYLESLNTRMLSNLLTNLSSKGILNSAYDSELNDFIFWPKENNENTKK